MINEDHTTNPGWPRNQNTRKQMPTEEELRKTYEDEMKYLAEEMNAKQQDMNMLI